MKAYLGLPGPCDCCCDEPNRPKRTMVESGLSMQQSLHEPVPGTAEGVPLNGGKWAGRRNY